MQGRCVVLATLVFFLTEVSPAQNAVEQPATVPIYKVTVTERTLPAVNYQYRSGPTLIGFRGTVLLPQSKGEATVESKRGRTEIDAKLDHLAAPTRFGREYLTYVLWAITPEGHAKNLGELVADGSDKAKLKVTTDLQAFGLMVTAEPYSAVRQPSDVVVLENQLRPETTGRTEPVQAKYELLPRGHYTYNVPAEMTAAEAAAPRLPFDQYESILELYQAQNAVQIARSVGADRYAGDTFARAEQLLGQAQAMVAAKAGVSNIVTIARQAAQTAEDARAIAIKRSQDAELAKARDEAASARQAQAQAEATAAQARNEAAAARATLEEERAHQEADREAPVVAPIQEPARAPEAPAPPPPPSGEQQRQLRIQLGRQLNAVLPTRDTPRGLVTTVSDAYFRSTSLDPALYGRLAGLAAILRAHPGLIVEVEGHTDDHGDHAYLDRLSTDRAATIRNVLVRQGVPAGAVFARGFGGSRPLGPNTSGAERERNRRVEIVVSGSPIGDLAAWDKSYDVTIEKR